MTRLSAILLLLKVVPVVIMAGFCFYQLHLLLNHRKRFVNNEITCNHLSELETRVFEQLRQQLRKNLLLQQAKDHAEQILQQKLKSLEVVTHQQKKQMQLKAQQPQQIKQSKLPKTAHETDNYQTMQSGQTNFLQKVEVQGERLSLHPSVNLVSSVPARTSTMDPRMCFPLPKSPLSTRICIRDPETDPLLSGVIQAGELWEDGYVQNMQAILKAYPDMGLVDIGANIGVYTLSAAASGRKVLSVEMQPVNILHLQHSLQLSNLSERVAIVKNAVYKDHNSQLSYKTYVDNAARSYIVENSQGTDTLQSVCLDDLIPLVTFPAVFLRLDLANTEHHALVCGQEFFNRVNVKVVQVKWDRKPPGIANWIGGFMSHFNYTASVFIDGVYHLWDVRLSNWTGDVFFFK